MSKTQQPDQIPQVLRGTLITIRRRCGKSTCRCANGSPHESPALSVSLSGRSITISLRPAEVPAVQAALQRYSQGHQKLQDQASDGIQQLRTRHRR